MKNFKSLAIANFCFLISFSFLMSCGGDAEPAASPATTVNNTPTQKLEKRFELVAPQASGVTFSNTINEDYNHSRLLQSRNSRAEIWPIVADWLLGRSV